MYYKYNIKRFNRHFHTIPVEGQLMLRSAHRLESNQEDALISQSLVDWIFSAPSVSSK